MSSGHQLDPSSLREYDIRGIVGKTLSNDDAFFIGRAFGTTLAERGGLTAAVGYDGRHSSPDIEAALVDGLKASGVDVVRVGLGPSPMLYYATHVLNCDAGLMVTGSHNPPEFNGIKMTMFGKAFFAEEIQKIGEIAASAAFIDGEGSANDHSIELAYVDRLFEEFRGRKPLKVAWDPGNGAAGDVLVKLIDKLPGEHFIINEKIDGSFPAHHPDPTIEKNLEQLKVLVAENGCDIGIGLDGDGDRIGIIDAQGRVLWGDQQMVLLAKEILLEQPGAPIIIDIKASQMFTDEITRMGGQPVLWKTGHSHIKTKMVELGAPLAGEMSAHIFFKHRYYGYDDALYAAVRFLSILASGDQTLAELYDALPTYVNTPEIRFDCDDVRKFAVVEEIHTRLKDQAGVQINAIDGVRVTNDDGWWLLRASNTQAMLALRCESNSVEGLERLKGQLLDQLELSGVSAPEF